MLSEPTGELDFDEFRKAIRRHGRMSVRSVTDNELKEVFAVVDKDSGGTVSAVSSLAAVSCVSFVVVVPRRTCWQRRDEFEFEFESCGLVVPCAG